jgi:hypothetical protein
MTSNLYSITATVAGSDLAPMTFIVAAADQNDAVEGAIQDAILNGVDEALLEAASFSVLDISQFAFEFVSQHSWAYEPTLFEKCVEAAEGEDDLVRRVIQTIIDNTDSSYTIDELVGILAQEGA